MKVNVLEGHHQMLGADTAETLLDIEVKEIRLFAFEIVVVIASWNGYLETK